MTLRNQILFSPLDLPLHTAYSYDEWANWIREHTDPNFYLYKYYTNRQDVYPWTQLDLEYKQGWPCELASRFPLFIEHLKLLPLKIKFLRFIVQRPGLDGPWHSDVDEHDLGFRICLAGDEAARTFRVCSFKDGRRQDVVTLNRAPWIDTPHGRINAAANELMDWSTVARPAGIKSGVTWVVTSKRGFHSVEPIGETSKRIQVVVNGDPEPGLEELLARSIQNPNCLMLASSTPVVSRE